MVRLPFQVKTVLEKEKMRFNCLVHEGVIMFQLSTFVCFISAKMCSDFKKINYLQVALI